MSNVEDLLIQYRQLIMEGKDKLVAAGRTLIEIKAALKHGEFGPWLKKHEINQATANEHMRIARGDHSRRNHRGAKSGDVPENELDPFGDEDEEIKAWIATFAAWPTKKKKLAYSTFLKLTATGVILK